LIIPFKFKGTVEDKMESMFHIDSFYDRNIRLWTAIVKDQDGNQIGDAQYGSREDFVILDAKYLIRSLLEKNQNHKSQ